MSQKPDPTQIVAATLRRLLPQEAGAAELLAQVAIHELQRHGWLADWEPVRVNGGFQAHPPQ